MVRNMQNDTIPISSSPARVADAVIEPRPEGVIRTCCGEAEEILDEGRSKFVLACDYTSCR
jgi:hypothetical protein